MESIHFPIEGDKVRLRPFELRDIGKAYLSWLNDPEVTRFSNQRFRRQDEASAKAYLQSFEGTPNLFLLVERRSDDAPIGTLTGYVSHHGTVDVGIMIGERSAWGSGFGHEAWSLLVDRLLEAPGIRKVTAGTLASNLAMIRLAEKSGMRLEGRRRDQELVDGQPVDILYFARFRNA